MRGHAPRTDFEKAVHLFVRRVPKGRVTTYALVARGVGHPGASRAVGNVMRRNPDTATTPCHRVVKSDGSIGGYMGLEDQTHVKVSRLKGEGVTVEADGSIRDFDRVVWPAA